MISTNIVQIFDLVYPNDPVLTCERLLESIERWPFVGHASSSYPILRLPGWEEGIEVIVRHFVPDTICQLIFEACALTC